MLTVAILTLAFVVLGVTLARRGDRPRRPPQVDDPAELREAEDEVRDLPVDADPESGWAGDDWGPGAGGGRRP